MGWALTQLISVKRRIVSLLHNMVSGEMSANKYQLLTSSETKQLQSSHEKKNPLFPQPERHLPESFLVCLQSLFSPEGITCHLCSNIYQVVSFEEHLQIKFKSFFLDCALFPALFVPEQSSSWRSDFFIGMLPSPTVNLQNSLKPKAGSHPRV